MWALYGSDDVINKCLSVMICYSEGGNSNTSAQGEVDTVISIYDLMSGAYSIRWHDDDGIFHLTG